MDACGRSRFILTRQAVNGQVKLVVCEQLTVILHNIAQGHSAGCCIAGTTQAGQGAAHCAGRARHGTTAAQPYYDGVMSLVHLSKWHNNQRVFCLGRLCPSGPRATCTTSNISGFHAPLDSTLLPACCSQPPRPPPAPAAPRRHLRDQRHQQHTDPGSWPAAQPCDQHLVVCVWRMGDHVQWHNSRPATIKTSDALSWPLDASTHVRECYLLPSRCPDTSDAMLTICFCQQPPCMMHCDAACLAIASVQCCHRPPKTNGFTCSHQGRLHAEPGGKAYLQKQLAPVPSGLHGAALPSAPAKQ